MKPIVQLLVSFPEQLKPIKVATAKLSILEYTPTFPPAVSELQVLHQGP